MKKIVLAAIAVALVGCVGDKSPFLGSWQSPSTGAKYLILEGGECRYTNNEGLGQHCTWEADKENDRRMMIRIEEGRFFVDAETLLAAGEMMVFFPNGMDSFLPDT